MTPDAPAGTGRLAPHGDVQISAERDADPVQQQQRRGAQHLRQINRHAVRIGDRVHQRPRQIHQPAAPQHAIGEFENMQADRIAAGRLVVADKSLGLQRPQNVVRGAAMEAGGAGDLARIQRPLRTVQDAQHFCRRDNRAHRFARIASAEIDRQRSRRAAPLGSVSRPFAWRVLERESAGCGRSISRLIKRIDPSRTA